MTPLEAFPALASALDYPMFVVSAAAGQDLGGCLVGFVTQCSIDPVRFLVCLSEKNHTCAVAQRSDRLAVHLLDAGQRPVAELFGTQTGSDVDKFAACRWTPGPGGVPLLDECPNRLVGRVLRHIDAGDHVVFLLEIEEVQAEGPGPLLTFQKVRDLDPGHEP